MNIVVLIGYVWINFRVENKEQDIQQQVEQQEQQSYHVSDESDGYNHTHPKLDLKNFHTQLW